jgi:hypothetical protein
MDDVTNMTMPELKPGNGQVSILDESLFTGESKQYKIYCTADPGFLSIAAVDFSKNKFTGFEAFHFDKLLTEDQLAKKISGLTQQSSILKKVDFRNASVLLGSSRFTFIPSALFKEEDAKEFFYFNQRSIENEMIHFDRLPGFDLVNLFGVPASLHAAFTNLFENFTVHHHLSAILEAASLHTSKQSSPPLFIHLHSSAMDIVVLNERRLVFANSFSFRTVDDAIYFVMMVCEQLQLNPEKSDVVLSGEIEADSSFARHLRKFLPQLSFAERTRSVAFTYGFDNLPGHFYNSAFSHLLCES